MNSTFQWYFSGKTGLFGWKIQIVSMPIPLRQFILSFIFMSIT
jgi:hypothetical protein